MNNCDRLQRKLVSGEELTEDERRHLGDCRACGALLETRDQVEAAAAAHRLIDGSALPAPAHRRPVYLRLVFSSLAVLVCLAVAAVFIARRLDSLDREAATGQRVLSLMDAVGVIADADDSGELQLDSSTPIMATMELYETQDEDDDRLELPPTYEYLEEALSNNWL